MDTLTLTLTLALILVLAGTIASLIWLTPQFVSFFGGGAPYVPSRDQTLKRMIRLAEIKPGDTVIDLGSGDGKVVFAALEAGAGRAIGYEIRSDLVKKSRARAHELGLADKAEFIAGSMWKADLSPGNVVFIYQLPYTMKFMQKKMRRELPAQARLVSNAFEFPDWQPHEKEEFVFVYKK